MTGAMYAAVSGLKAHMSALNVIGNNVANVNTNAYKASRFTFLESLYTSVSGGANGTQNSGGKNPAQVGYGCSLGTIDLDMSTKNYSPTGQSLDTMIDGDGFFLVGHKGATSYESLELSRLGNFGFDNEGYLVDGQGKVVYGFPTVAADGGGTEVSKYPAPLRYPCASATDGTAVYPSVSDEGIVTFPDDTDPTTVDGVLVLESVGINEVSGAISGICPKGNPIVIGYIAIGKVDNPNGVTHVDGHYYKALDGAGVLHLTAMDSALENADEEEGPIVISAGGTNLITGGLESSGTDLASEITSMITVQRGYQANTRIVTVTDSMLEELVNMKR